MFPFLDSSQVRGGYFVTGAIQLALDRPAAYYGYKRSRGMISSGSGSICSQQVKQRTAPSPRTVPSGRMYSRWEPLSVGQPHPQTTTEVGVVGNEMTVASVASSWREFVIGVFLSEWGLGDARQAGLNAGGFVERCGDSGVVTGSRHPAGVAG